MLPALGRRIVTIGGLFAIAMLLASCGGGGGAGTPAAGSGSLQGPSSSNQPLTAQQMTEVVNASVPEFTSGYATNLDTVTTSTGSRSAQSNPCIHASPLPQVINPDGLPANETYSHDNCTNLDWAPNMTVNGDINITDTSNNRNSLSYTQTDINLSLAGNDLSGVPFTEVRNGQRFVTAPSSHELSVTRQIDALRTLPTQTIEITNDWEWHFTAAPGLSVQLLRKLPAGQFDEAHGTAAHSNGASIVVVGFSIAQPLQFDPTCTTPPAFTSGQIKYTQAGGANPGKFTATFSGCGIPPVIAPA